MYVLTLDDSSLLEDGLRMVAARQRNHKVPSADRELEAERADQLRERLTSGGRIIIVDADNNPRGENQARL